MPQVMLAQALAKEPPEGLPEDSLEVPPVAEATSKRHLLSRHASQQQKLAKGAARTHPARHSGAQGMSMGAHQRTREEARLSDLSAEEEQRHHPSMASRTNAPAALSDIVLGLGKATEQEGEEQVEDDNEEGRQESASGSTLWASVKRRLPDVLESGRSLPESMRLPEPRRTSRESIRETDQFLASETGFRDAPPSARRKLSRTPSIPSGLLQRSSSLQPMTETEPTPEPTQEVDLAEVSSALGRASVMAQLEIDEALDS